MTQLKDKIIDAGLADRVLTDTVLTGLLGGSAAARYGKVNKAFKQRELIKIRRGLCLLADKYRHQKISQFFLANQITPHSYISLESALSYHGWIPERVAMVTSVITTSRTKVFTTHFGEFFFYQLPVNEYTFLTGVTRVEEIKCQPFLLASPLRALADYVYVRKVDWTHLAYLTDGLRINIDHLMGIEPNQFIELQTVYRSKRVLHFLDSLQQELKKQ